MSKCVNHCQTIKLCVSCVSHIAACECKAGASTRAAFAAFTKFSSATRPRTWKTARPQDQKHVQHDQQEKTNIKNTQESASKNNLKTVRLNTCENVRRQLQCNRNGRNEKTSRKVKLVKQIQNTAIAWNCQGMQIVKACFLLHCANLNSAPFPAFPEAPWRARTS